MTIYGIENEGVGALNSSVRDARILLENAKIAVTHASVSFILPDICG